MNSIEQRIAAEEWQARIGREQVEVQREARARAQPRYVTLAHDQRGMELTIRGVANRPMFGWCGVIFGLVTIGFGAVWLAGSVPAAIAIMTIGIALAIGSLQLVIWPRSTLRLLATPAGFAVFTRPGDEPAYVGRHDSLNVHRYEWCGRTGVSLRVWNSQYWAASYMGIAHPDDFATIEEFNRRRGRH